MDTVMIEYPLADGKRICIEVSIEVKEHLERFDRQIRSLRRQDRRHLDFTEFADDQISTNAMLMQGDVADLLIQLERFEQLHRSIETLTVKQRRRLALRFGREMSYRQIARYEKVNPKTVSESIKQALVKLRQDLQLNR